MTPPLITLLTDFGTRDAYAGILRGVILQICPAARIVDLTHSVPPQDVRSGALLLHSAVDYFPPGSIHVAVVDPGVGSERAAVLVQTPGATFVGPDNGLLEYAAARRGIERIIGLTRAEYHLPTVSRTFHGRDVFAPVAAHLANGVAPDSFGAARAALVPLGLPAPRADGTSIAGEVVYVDGYGNLVTNIATADLKSFSTSDLSVSIGACASVPLVSTYADVEPDAVLALIGSWGHLEIAVRGGNAAARLAAQVGCPVRVTRRPRA